MMMLYRRRASPKLRDDMTEVEYGGGGHRTRLRNDLEDQLVCHGVPPAPVYKGARGEEAGPRRGRAKCGVLLGLPSPSRIPPPLLELEKGKEGERKKERGVAPLVQFGPEGGRRPPSFWPLSSIPVWPNKAHILPGEFP